MLQLLRKNTHILATMFCSRVFHGGKIVYNYYHEDNVDYDHDSNEDITQISLIVTFFMLVIHKC